MSAANATEHEELLRIGELAERVRRTGGDDQALPARGPAARAGEDTRNMAYYPPEFVERIRLIKQLQEERFMPLKVIRELLERGPRAAPRR